MLQCQKCYMIYKTDHIDAFMDHLQFNKCLEYERNNNGFIYVWKLHYKQIKPFIKEANLTNHINKLCERIKNLTCCTPNNECNNNNYNNYN